MVILVIYMEKIKIYSLLSNSDNDNTTIEALADFDKEKNIIKYKEEDLQVTIQILDKKVLIERKNEEYNLNLVFSQNERVTCKYQVDFIGLNLEIDVYTKILEIEENRIYINYELFNDNKSIGTFEYKLLVMEWRYEHKKNIKRNNW